jgi:6-phosphogluconolactonase (cycloisomerase 2 family)
MTLHSLRCVRRPARFAPFVLTLALLCAAPTASAASADQIPDFLIQWLDRYAPWMLVGGFDGKAIRQRPWAFRIVHWPAPLPPAQAATDGSMRMKSVADYGALVPIEGALNTQCSGASGVALDPSGEFVYIPGYGSPSKLCGFRIDPDTQAFTPIAGMPVLTGDEPRAVAIEPSGKFLYVASLLGNSVWGYAIDRATGKTNPVAGSPFATGGLMPQGMVIDRAGRFLYAANNQGAGTFAGSVAAFAIDRASGALIAVAGSPFALTEPQFSEAANALALTPDSRHLYAGGGSLATFAVNATTGALTRIAKRYDVYVSGLAVDPTGRFLYVTDAVLGAVVGFAIDSNGALSRLPASYAVGANALGITVIGDLVYVAGRGADLLYGFRINPATGALTPVSGSPVVATDKPAAVAGRGLLGNTLAIDAGAYYAAEMGVFGGAPPYAWSIVSGVLPPGLTLDAKTGVVSGTVGGSGNYALAVRVTDSAGAVATQNKSITVQAAGTPIVSTAVEFYNVSLDHYFITYVADEIGKLDNGTFKGWTRTGLSFKVFATAQSGTTAVCRIYIPPGKGDGHFFGRDANECDGTMTKNPTFILESSTFLYLYPPTLGTCATGQVPVYRVFSNRADANHRYTTDRAVRDQMVAKGWLAEGDGADTVVMCAPS